MNTHSLTLTTRDDFEHWLSAMDDFLDEFAAGFSDSERHQLDFSPESLEIVERWIIRKYAITDAVLLPSESGAINRAACYVGEVFRKTIGGRWDIRLDDPCYAFHAMPIIVAGKFSECPLSLVAACADRRTGKYLRSVLSASALHCG